MHNKLQKIKRSHRGKSSILQGCRKVLILHFCTFILKLLSNFNELYYFSSMKVHLYSVSLKIMAVFSLFVITYVIMDRIIHYKYSK